MTLTKLKHFRQLFVKNACPELYENPTNCFLGRACLGRPHGQSDGRTDGLRLSALQALFHAPSAESLLSAKSDEPYRHRAAWPSPPAPAPYPAQPIFHRSLFVCCQDYRNKFYLVVKYPIWKSLHLWRCTALLSPEHSARTLQPKAWYSSALADCRIGWTNPVACPVSGCEEERSVFCLWLMSLVEDENWPELYLKMQSVPRSKHTASVVKATS